MRKKERDWKKGIDKKWLWGEWNIEKRELCVREILEQDFGYVWRPFPNLPAVKRGVRIPYGGPSVHDRTVEGSGVKLALGCGL